MQLAFRVGWSAALFVVATVSSIALSNGEFSSESKAREGKLRPSEASVAAIVQVSRRISFVHRQMQLPQDSANRALIPENAPVSVEREAFRPHIEVHAPPRIFLIVTRQDCS